MPLTEHHDRGLYLKDQPGELKGRIMVVRIQVVEQLKVAWVTTLLVELKNRRRLWEAGTRRARREVTLWVVVID
jgi:hypothetical protein